MPPGARLNRKPHVQREQGGYGCPRKGSFWGGCPARRAHLSSLASVITVMKDVESSMASKYSVSSSSSLSSPLGVKRLPRDMHRAAASVYNPTKSCLTPRGEVQSPRGATPPRPLTSPLHLPAPPYFGHLVLVNLVAAALTCCSGTCFPVSALSQSPLSFPKPVSLFVAQVPFLTDPFPGYP